MANGNDYSGGGGPQMGPQDEKAFLAYLKQTFEKLPNEISLILFSKAGEQDIFSDLTEKQSLFSSIPHVFLLSGH